jgi:hypothetical protein
MLLELALGDRDSASCAVEQDCARRRRTLVDR